MLGLALLEGASVLNWLAFYALSHYMEKVLQILVLSLRHRVLRKVALAKAHSILFRQFLYFINIIIEIARRRTWATIYPRELRIILRCSLRFPTRLALGFFLFQILFFHIFVNEQSLMLLMHALELFTQRIEHAGLRRW